MEKQRLVFINDEVPEEPIPCDSYICDFSEGQATLAKIDELMRNVDSNSKAKDFVTYHD